MTTKIKPKVLIGSLEVAAKVINEQDKPSAAKILNNVATQLRTGS